MKEFAPAARGGRKAESMVQQVMVQQVGAVTSEDGTGRAKGRSSLVRSPQFSSYVILVILLVVFGVDRKSVV